MLVFSLELRGEFQFRNPNTTFLPCVLAGRRAGDPAGMPASHVISWLFYPPGVFEFSFTGLPVSNPEPHRDCFRDRTEISPEIAHRKEVELSFCLVPDVPEPSAVGRRSAITLN